MKRLLTVFALTGALGVATTACTPSMFRTAVGAAIVTAAIVGTAHVLAHHDHHYHDHYCGHDYRYHDGRYVYYYGGHWEYYDPYERRWYYYVD